MRPARLTVAAGLLTALAGAPTLAAQVPPALDFPASPSIVAMGGAGTAAWGEAGAVLLNPALAATGSHPVIEFSVFHTPSVDQGGLAAAIGARGPLGATYVVEFRQKGVEDLIEDPSLDDSDLSVSDATLRLAVAGSMAGGRIAVGVAGTAAWSSVLATDGHAMFVDLGAAARIHRHLVVAAAVRRVGSDLAWEVPGGNSFETGLAPAMRLGVALPRIAAGPIRASASADVEYGSSLGEVEFGFGLQVAILDAACFRAGLARPGGGSPIWTGGIGLSLAHFQLDLAYEAVEFVGRRFHLGLRYAGEGR